MCADEEENRKLTWKEQNKKTHTQAWQLASIHSVLAHAGSYPSHFFSVDMFVAICVNGFEGVFHVALDLHAKVRVSYWESA